MNRLTKYLAFAAVAVTMVAGIATAYAAGQAQTQGPATATPQGQAAPQNLQGFPPQGGPRGGPRGGLEGKVTADSNNSLTLVTPQNNPVTVNISGTTTVHVMLTGATGSLSDIKVGSNVQIRGARASTGNVDARDIVVEPDGDQAGGRVSAVSGDTITVQSPQGDTKIVTNSSTKFVTETLGTTSTGTATLADVTAGKSVRVFGTKGTDGSLTATVVFVGGDRGPRGAGGPNGGFGRGPNGPAPCGIQNNNGAAASPASPNNQAPALPTGQTSSVQ